MSNSISTVNPFTSETIESFKKHTKKDVENMMEASVKTFKTWKDVEIDDRTKILQKLADLLDEQKDECAELISKEMGKPITQSIAEIEKCVFLCDFYVKNADILLSDELIDSDADESFVSYDPLGPILGIMPWNYPYWQVMRFAVPTLTAGNTVFLKHAANVTGSALKMQDLFEKAGYPKGCFQTIVAGHDIIENMIASDHIKAVSLTGSEKAGRAIAEVSGRHLKKLVLELGGNNACIILKDADLDTHMETIVNARMQNTGQSCIAAKRFIIEATIYDDFKKRFLEKVKEIKVGDPLDESSDMGTLAREDLVKTLKKQVDDSVAKGATVLIGNETEANFFKPTILENVKSGMPVFDEETFGPVAAFIKVKDKQEAYRVTANTKFGLGTMIFTQDTEDAFNRIADIEDGAFFINEMVKSDPRLPFGGTKSSGYGRELSREGILAFVNKKTVYINK